MWSLLIVYEETDMPMFFSVIHLQYVFQLSILPPQKEKDMGSLKEVIERWQSVLKVQGSICEEQFSRLKPIYTSIIVVESAEFFSWREDMILFPFSHTILRMTDS